MQDARATREDIYPIGKKNPNLPFHPAVRAGDFIFVSGQVAKDADGNMISGTIEEETQGTIEASNVDVGDSMTEMIDAQRSFQLASRAVQMQDQMLQIANQVKS